GRRAATVATLRCRGRVQLGFPGQLAPRPDCYFAGRRRGEHPELWFRQIRGNGNGPHRAACAAIPRIDECGSRRKTKDRNCPCDGTIHRRRVVSTDILDYLCPVRLREQGFPGAVPVSGIRECPL